MKPFVDPKDPAVRLSRLEKAIEKLKRRAIPDAGVTSLAKSGDTPLVGDVTLSEGDNVTLAQVGQDIEIAAALGLPYYFARLTDVYAGPNWIIPGGRDYRARGWRSDSGLTDLSHMTPGFVGWIDSVGAGFDRTSLRLTGTFLVTATVRATFPAQQAVREAGIFVGYGGSPGPIDPTHGAQRALRMFDLSVASPPGSDVDETFETSFVVSGTDVRVVFNFGEDDINEDRTTTLSTAWVLEVLALQLP